MHRLLSRLALALALALVATVVAAGASVAADKWVTTYDSKYLPGVVTIRTGERVTWVNDDDLPHDATGNGWATPLLNKGDSYSLRFNRAGTYRYYCSIHPEMRSAVIVLGAGGVPGTDVAAPLGDARRSGEAPIALLVLAATFVGFRVALRFAVRR
jgi:plastocyanin